MEDLKSIFVRNLPFGVSQEEVEQLFSDVGPVRKVSLIKDKGKRKSEAMTRGFAFIKFAMEADAQNAINTLHRTEFQGRKLLIELAKKKSSKNGEKTVDNVEGGAVVPETTPVVDKVKIEVKTEEEPAREQYRTTAEVEGKVQSERNARRREHRALYRKVEEQKELRATSGEKTVVIYGLPTTVSKKHIFKKAKKFGNVVKTEVKQPTNDSKDGKIIAYVEFATLKDADLAAMKLDNHVFKGSKMTVRKLATNDPATQKKNSRLIVRNLAFQVNDEDLAKLFEECGPISEAKVVRMPVGDDSEDSIGRSRGFGFVQYVDANSAAKAIEVLNGKKIKGREMVIDVAISKSEFVQVSQKTNEESELKKEPPIDDGNDEGTNEDDGHNLEEEGNDDIKEDDESSDDDEDDNDSDNEDEDDNAETNEMKIKPKMAADSVEDLNRTLFLRNVSFQSTEEGITSCFEEFGAIEYVKIVIDRQLGMPKGVAFVRFKSSSSASAAIKAGNITSDSKHSRKNKSNSNNNMSALLDGNGITLDGRTLNVSIAVDRNNASRLEEENSVKRKALDKRNLYLGQEGYVAVNENADEQVMLPKGDIEKRQRASKDRKEKLKNPLIFISPNRLSVRNLHLELADKELKQLFRTAAIEGIKEKLVTNEDIKEQFRPTRPVPVKIVMGKIVRDTENVKPGLEPKSRGFGFIEFSEHLHAVAALRKLNNNPAYSKYAYGGKVATKTTPGNKIARLIIEFALEDHKKLQLREKRKQLLEKKRKEIDAVKEAQGLKKNDEKKMSRGKRQRANKLKKLEEEKKSSNSETKAKRVKIEEEKKEPSRKRDRNEEQGESEDVKKKKKKRKSKKTQVSSGLSRREKKASVKKETANERHFEDLVQNYKKQLFGKKAVDEEGSTYENTKNPVKLERWFDDE